MTVLASLHVEKLQRQTCVPFLFSLSVLASPVLAAAETNPQDVLVELRNELDRLQKETALRVAAIERRIDEIESGITRGSALPAANGAESVDSRVAEIETQLHEPSRQLSLFGDFRIRYEHTGRHAGLAARDRGVMRGRLGASYSLNKNVTLGARLATGDRDDPNSTDVTIGGFFDDLDVSLDLAYAQYDSDGFSIIGGKIRNPFNSSDLVWDGDVNPYGIAGRVNLFSNDRFSMRFAAIYSIVDEQTVGEDSDMAGGQLLANYVWSDDWSATLSTAYYDYSIGSLVNADAGDIRDNNVTPNGTAYVSDFNLFDIVSSVRYAGVAPDWPFTLAGQYVRNTGARVPEDSAYSIELFAGNATHAGDLRLRYGFALAEKDAVLAAFSHDNTTYATNYKQHTLSLDYVPIDGTVLNLTGYYYKREDFGLENQPGDNDYLPRLRLNIQFLF